MKGFPSMTMGVYARTIRTGRRSARSRWRLEDLHRAPTGTETPEGLLEAAGEGGA